jgi:hypothetical protein
VTTGLPEQPPTPRRDTAPLRPERERLTARSYRPPATDVRVDSLPAGVADGLLAIARAIDRLADAIGAAKETESDG